MWVKSSGFRIFHTKKTAKIKESCLVFLFHPKFDIYLWFVLFCREGGWKSSKDFWPIIVELTWVHSEIGLGIRLLDKLQIFWQDLSDMPSVCVMMVIRKTFEESNLRNIQVKHTQVYQCQLGTPYLSKIDEICLTSTACRRWKRERAERV